MFGVLDIRYGYLLNVYSYTAGYHSCGWLSFVINRLLLVITWLVITAIMHLSWVCIVYLRFYSAGSI